MNDQLKAAMREVEAQLVDGRSKERSFGEGVVAWNAWTLIKQALDGMSEPPTTTVRTEPEIKLKNLKKPRTRGP
jgi:hypothetical protein